MSEQDEVIVVGAGLSGLATALGLALRGRSRDGLRGGAT